MKLKCQVIVSCVRGLDRTQTPLQKPWLCIFGRIPTYLNFHILEITGIYFSIFLSSCHSCHGLSSLTCINTLGVVVAAIVPFTVTTIFSSFSVHFLLHEILLLQVLPNSRLLLLSLLPLTLWLLPLLQLLLKLSYWDHHHSYYYYLLLNPIFLLVHLHIPNFLVLTAKTIYLLSYSIATGTAV